MFTVTASFTASLSRMSRHGPLYRHCLIDIREVISLVALVQVSTTMFENKPSPHKQIPFGTIPATSRVFAEDLRVFAAAEEGHLTLTGSKHKLKFAKRRYIDILIKSIWCDLDTNGLEFDICGMV